MFIILTLLDIYWLRRVCLNPVQGLELSYTVTFIYEWIQISIYSILLTKLQNNALLIT